MGEGINGHGITLLLCALFCLLHGIGNGFCNILGIKQEVEQVSLCLLCLWLVLDNFAVHC